LGHEVSREVVGYSLRNFSFPDEPTIIGQVINAFCSLCGIGIGDHHNDVRGTVARVLCRGKKGGVEEIQAVLCTTCLMRMKREGQKEQVNRA
jgi:hypothetical protein